MIKLVAGTRVLSASLVVIASLGCEGPWESLEGTAEGGGTLRASSVIIKHESEFFVATPTQEGYVPDPNATPTRSMPTHLRRNTRASRR